MNKQPKWINEPIKRSDIVKWADLGNAVDSLNFYTTHHFVYLGNSDDARPYWVVDAKTATKLDAQGYERA